MRQCAEDACIALGFINPGDVATMMARMKKALKGLARCWTLYNLSWAVLALKAAFSMTRTTNVHGAVVWEYPRFETQACASAAMYARAAMRKSPFTLALALLAHALPQPRCVYHTGSASCRSG